MIRRLRLSVSLLVCASLSVPALAKEAPKSPVDVTKGSVSSHAMVAAANPAATAAGLKVLKAGGTAADAAVAIQAMLALVEPESTSVSGGSFMVFYDAKTKAVTAYDGRETAPSAATPQWFMDGGKPLTFVAAVTSGRSTGVPGAIAMLKLVHGEHGKLPWASLFTDAEQLADAGFTITKKLGNAINGPFPQAKTADATAYFTKPDGTRYRSGETMKNPAYAATLRAIAAQGPDAILKGPIAQDIVDRVHQGDHPSTLTLADMAAYKSTKADALCVTWKVTYRVCTSRPPSGGSALLHALLLSEHTDIDKRGPNDPVGWTEMAQIERLMYADRDLYVGDPAFVKIPTEGWLSPAYVAERAKLISNTAVGPWPTAGKPPGAGDMFGPDHTIEPGGTTHLVVVDKWGNVVSMTTTVESIFGSGRMVDGFFLNNQLTDFSFAPVQPDGTPAANQVLGGKRPRSAMSPVIVLNAKTGKLVAAMGTPGGPSIISYNLKAMIGVFDWHLPLQAAFDLPNMVARGGQFSSEAALYAPGVVDGMAKLGLTIREGTQENSGMHGVLVENGKLIGAADRRREGVARGY